MDSGQDLTEEEKSDLTSWFLSMLETKREVFETDTLSLDLDEDHPARRSSGGGLTLQESMDMFQRLVDQEKHSS